MMIFFTKTGLIRVIDVAHLPTNCSVSYFCVSIILEIVWSFLFLSCRNEVFSWKP